MLGRSLFECNKNHLLSQARSELMKQRTSSWISQSSYQKASATSLCSKIGITGRSSWIFWVSKRTSSSTSYEGKTSPGYSNTKYSWIGWDEESSRTTSWRILVQNKRKSRHNTETHFTVAGDARADEFYERFRGISGCGIESLWKFVSRSQSTSSDSKFSFHAEPRQTLATWHMEHVWITWKTFLVVNFLHLVCPEIIIKKFTIVRHKERERISSTSDWDRDLFRKRWREK